MALDGILVDVDQVTVAGLLQQRQPLILEEGDPVQEDRFVERVRGAAVQVLSLVGPDPVAGPIRSMAVEAIALETGSGIEYAEFPEQQGQGLDGRGYHLHQRYLELLANLTKLVTYAGTVPQTGGGTYVPMLPNVVPSPVGDYPAPLGPHPDPAEIPAHHYGWGIW